MWPMSNQPARHFATTKAHKFANIKQIDINDLKLCPMIDQTGTHFMTVPKYLPNIYNC